MAALMWHSEEDNAVSYFPEIAICVIILSSDQCMFDHKASETMCDEDDGDIVAFLLPSRWHVLNLIGEIKYKVFASQSAYQITKKPAKYQALL